MCVQGTANYRWKCPQPGHTQVPVILQQVTYHTLTYHTTSYLTVPYGTYPNISNHTIPYYTLPHHTMSYCTLPYHVISYTPIGVNHNTERRVTTKAWPYRDWVRVYLGSVLPSYKAWGGLGAQRWAPLSHDLTLLGPYSVPKWMMFEPTLGIIDWCKGIKLGTIEWHLATCWAPLSDIRPHVGHH